jgi:hypothetical protein
MGAITEPVWLTENNRPKDLANFALRHATDRRVRLFGVACCALVSARLQDQRCHLAVDVALRYADALAGAEELQAANAAVTEAADESWSAAGYKDTADTAALRLAENASSVSMRLEEGDGDGWQSFGAGGSTSDFFIGHTLEASPGDALVRAQITQLLRDILGNPFHPVAFFPEWRTDTVAALARQMYASRDFSALSILADALQDAGCDNQDILEHCRGSGPHVRGCWVVDLVLGKE